MKFMVSLPHPNSEKGEFLSGEDVIDFAKAMERVGVMGCCLSEHPAPSAEWLRNDPGGHVTFDPFTSLAFAAAATKRLMVATNVLILPYRNAFLTAKAASTLQLLSGNRFILGAGVGYQQVEFEALGVPFAQRGALTDEALETIRLAWSGGPVVKRGKTFNAAGNDTSPIPSTLPPIWIGGGSDKAVERAARWGDGWQPYFSVPTNDPTVRTSAVVSMAHFGEKVKRLKELRQQMNRSTPFDLAVGSPHRPKTTRPSDAEQILEGAHQLEAYGTNWLWTNLPAPSRAGFLESVAWFGEEVIARFNTK